MATHKQRKLNKIKEVRGEKAARVQELWALETEDNDLTDDQKEEILELTKQIEQLKDDEKRAEEEVELEREVNAAAGKLTAPQESVDTDPRITSGPPKMKTLGEQFTSSESYKDLMSKGIPGGRWQTDPVELQTKATVLSGGTLSGFAPFQQFTPGVVETLFQRLYVADLMPQGVATSPQIVYNVENVATNAAGSVGEGVEKPESTLDFTTATDPVRKIATVLPVSDEMLEDAPQIEAYINQRLALFVRQAEETSLLRGAGGNDLIGFFSRGIGTTTVSGTMAGTGIVDGLFGFLNNIRGSGLLDPDAIILHPDDWAVLRQAKDQNDQYYGGGPFYGEYGNNGMQSASQFTQSQSVWGVRVVVTTAVGSGTTLAGAFNPAAQIFRRGGLSVDASNSHDQNFVRNITSIRAEERLALAVYRTEAFGIATFV